MCSGFNVINVKLGNTKFVPYLMVEEMMADKLNTLALTATFKRSKEESANPYPKVLFLEPRICQELFSVTT